MKASKNTHFASSASLAAIVVLSIGTVLGADPNQPVAKDHSLFVGQQVSVGVDGKYYPVVGAGSRSFIVEIDHHTREIYTSKANDVRVTRGLKLSSFTASITNLDVSSSSDRAAAAEMAGLQNAMAINADGQDRADAAHGNLVRQEWIASLGGGKLGDTQQQKADIKAANVSKADEIYLPILLNTMRATDHQDMENINRLLDTVGTQANTDESVQLMPEITSDKVQLSSAGGEVARSSTKHTASPVSPGNLGTAANAATSGPANPPSKSGRTIRDLGDGQSDRLDFTFEVSAHQPIDDAYLILTTEYINPSHAGINHRVLAQRIGRVEPTPRKIKLYEAGYPTGFHVKNYSINLYANGQELATNFSPDRLDLTRDEAYQYIVAEYLASHKGESHPPAAVLMAPKSELKAAGDLSHPVYVLVDHDGRVEKVSNDPSGNGDVGPTVRAALQHFRFIPALQNGRPVDGRAKLTLADFAQ